MAACLWSNECTEDSTAHHCSQSFLTVLWHCCVYSEESVQIRDAIGNALRDP